MFQHSKKGVSEMVAYSLLIVLAISLSLVVYSFIRALIPSEDLRCPEGISIVASSVSCEDDVLRVTLLNNGLFKINGAFIRFGNATQSIRTELQGTKTNDFWFTTGSTPTLLPGNSTYKVFNSAWNPGVYFIEIEPVVLNNKGKTISCSKSISVQRVTCISSLPPP